MTSVCCTPGCLGSASEAVSDHEPWVHRGGVHDKVLPLNPGPGRPGTPASAFDGCVVARRPTASSTGARPPGWWARRARHPLATLVSALTPDERRRLADM